MTEFTTPKGTKLPLMSIRGKPYLQVAHRLVWFREEHPDWCITTELIEHGNDITIARARIFSPEGHTSVYAHKHETSGGFADHLEKAETGAIGRALALLGYGTQFCAEEFDEGERLADAPTQPGKPVVGDPGAKGRVFKPELGLQAYSESKRKDMIMALLNRKSVPNIWRIDLVVNYLSARFNKDKLVDLTETEFEEAYKTIRDDNYSTTMNHLSDLKPAEDSGDFFDQP